jgi:hypothetical protein
MKRRQTDETVNEFPTEEEINRWVLDTIRHAWHIEFYLQRLQIGRSDIQRPHDIVGLGNKLEWPAIRGFAMQYRSGKDVFKTYVLPALEYHRQQFHHLAWNNFNPTASVDAMRLGAVDAVCSLLEPRDYQDGCHTWPQIRDISLKNPIHKVAWMLLLSQEMEAIEKPNIEEITLKTIPTEGITPESQEAIRERIFETTTMLKRDHGIILHADRRTPI